MPNGPSARIAGARNTAAGQKAGRRILEQETDQSERLSGGVSAIVRAVWEVSYAPGSMSQLRLHTLFLRRAV
jgi:hypothetical protein